MIYCLVHYALTDGGLDLGVVGDLLSVSVGVMKEEDGP